MASAIWEKFDSRSLLLFFCRHESSGTWKGQYVGLQLYHCKLTCLKMCTQIITLLSMSEEFPQSHRCFGFHVFFSSEGWIEESLRPSRLNKTLLGTRCLNSNSLGGQQFGQNWSLWGIKRGWDNYTLNLRGWTLYKQTSIWISSWILKHLWRTLVWDAAM